MNYQSGFRGYKFTIDQLFIIRRLFQKTLEFNQKLHSLYALCTIGLFVDFKKSHDCINRLNVYYFTTF